MKYITIDPPAELKEYVRFFWVLESQVAINDSYIHRSTADGCMEILFHYSGQFDEIYADQTLDKSFLSGFHGQSKRYRRFKIEKSFGIFGAYLYPFATNVLFKTPADELSDQMPDMQEMLGNAGRELEEKIMLAADNSERIQIMSDFLLLRLRNADNRDITIQQAIKQIINVDGDVNIEQLAGEFCLSKRQFERKFKGLAGFSPKLYTRIIRFQSVFNELNVTHPRLTMIAQKCGYYDQSHFIHDFSDFSGFLPKEFLRDDSTEKTIWIN